MLFCLGEDLLDLSKMFFFSRSGRYLGCGGRTFFINLLRMIKEAAIHSGCWAFKFISRTDDEPGGVSWVKDLQSVEL